MKTTKPITQLIMGAAFVASCAMGQPGPDAGRFPVVPAEIQAPDGNHAFLEGHAVGTQNYICLPSGSGFAWKFFSPQATVFSTMKGMSGDLQKQIITHFLSPNPDENGVGRVTWQSSSNSSAVRGKAVASITDPNIVAQGAIPWVLLQAVGTQQGPDGGHSLSRVTFVNRLNTSGGVAPDTGCSQSTDVGTTALVPYEADYVFYRAPKAN